VFARRPGLHRDRQLWQRTAVRSARAGEKSSRVSARQNIISVLTHHIHASKTPWQELDNT
jgi:hypothetical protein